LIEVKDDKAIELTSPLVRIIYLKEYLPIKTKDPTMRQQLCKFQKNENFPEQKEFEILQVG
jgi:hypothetical protein